MFAYLPPPEGLQTTHSSLITSYKGKGKSGLLETESVFCGLYSPHLLLLCCYYFIVCVCVHTCAHGYFRGQKERLELP